MKCSQARKKDKEYQKQTTTKFKHVTRDKSRDRQNIIPGGEFLRWTGLHFPPL